MHKFFIITGSLMGMLSVMIGAFGAHALKATLEATNRLETFETAVRYQFYHAMALILLGLLMIQFQHKAFNIAGYGFIIGILLFSGSLYGLSLTGITKLGAITPLGGLAFIIGWAAFAWGASRVL
ncbi:MAG: DUF423 domain-containing protein [Cyclobacteriaceae bacterium]|nr:DUF423 domain-containing protein [Cyclobacteriaceae bacterium]